MNQSQPNNPLHGVTLKAILEYLVDEHGWERLGERINIQCFNSDPSIKSSLKFLRKTEWAREKVERLYVYSISYDARHGKKNEDVNEGQVESEDQSEPERQVETEGQSEPEGQSKAEGQVEPGSVWDRARQNLRNRE